MRPLGCEAHARRAAQRLPCEINRTCDPSIVRTAQAIRALDIERKDDSAARAHTCDNNGPRCHAAAPMRCPATQGQLRCSSATARTVRAREPTLAPHIGIASKLRATPHRRLSVNDDRRRRETNFRALTEHVGVCRRFARVCKRRLARARAPAHGLARRMGHRRVRRRTLRRGGAEERPRASSTRRDWGGGGGGGGS